MHRCKAGVVAVGAIATVAAVGSAAAAAPAQPAHVPSGTSATTTLGIGEALLGTQFFDDEQGIDRPLISVGVGSKVSALPWEICGSTAVGGLIGTAATNSPHTVISDGVACANSNAMLKQDDMHGVISILDDSAVRVAPWQVCGSHVVAGVGVTSAMNSPATVVGDCHNANTVIEGPDGRSGGDGHGDWDGLSVLSGSVINVLPWQVCGASAVMGVGGVMAQNSPTTVDGDCINAATHIDDGHNGEPWHGQSSGPILSNVPLNILPLQVCETDSVGSLLGVVAAHNSPARVTGECLSPDGLDFQPWD